MSDHGDSINKLNQARAKSMKAVCGPSVLQRIAEDQEVKLIVFCTRPSVRKRYWIYCFWAKFSLTFFLTYGPFSISGRSISVTPGMPKSPEAGLYKAGLEPLHDPSLSHIQRYRYLDLLLLTRECIKF